MWFVAALDSFNDCRISYPLSVVSLYCTEKRHRSSTTQILKSLLNNTYWLNQGLALAMEQPVAFWKANQWLLFGLEWELPVLESFLIALKCTLNKVRSQLNRLYDWVNLLPQTTTIIKYYLSNQIFNYIFAYFAYNEKNRLLANK